jgi:ArsR family transcriptional regulator
LTNYFRARDEFEPVSRRELFDRLRAGTATVLDVRPEDEFRHGHLPGALNIPFAQLERRLAELPADLEIVAYCRGLVRPVVRGGRAASSTRLSGAPAGRRFPGMEGGRPADRLDNLAMR